VTTAAPARRFSGDFREDVLVLIVAALALIGAFFYQRSLAAQTTRFQDPNSGFSLSIPNNWTVNQSKEADVFVSAYNTRADSTFKSSITGRSFALDADKPSSLDTIVDGAVKDHQDSLTAFHLISTETITLGGAEGRAIKYAYVVQPIDQAFTDAAPVVIIATDYVAYSPAKEYWILTLAADDRIAAHEASNFGSIVGSIQLPAR
jgi:hypothetical protein